MMESAFWNWAVQSTSVTLLWACPSTALRAIVPWTNVSVTGSEKFAELFRGASSSCPPLYVVPSAALAQSIEHVLAHGCRDGE